MFSFLYQQIWCSYSDKGTGRKNDKQTDEKLATRIIKKVTDDIETNLPFTIIKNMQFKIPTETGVERKKNI